MVGVPVWKVSPLEVILWSAVAATVVSFIRPHPARPGPGAPGAVREYRYMAFLRYGALALIPCGCIGLAWLLQHSGFFFDDGVTVSNLTMYLALLFTGVLLALGPLVLYSQVYRVTATGIESRTVFWHTRVDWSAVTRMHETGTQGSLLIDSDPKPRFPFPAMVIMGFGCIGRGEELQLLVRSRVAEARYRKMEAEK